MPKRVTIILDDELIKKLYEIQAKKIRDTSGPVSFSGIINDVLKQSFKK